MTKPLNSTRQSYRKDIIKVILLKIVALGLLWWGCFSDPTEHHLTLDSLSRHFLVQ